MAKRRHNRKRHTSVVRVGELATPERRRQLGGMMSEIVDRDATGKAYIKRERAQIECVLHYYFKLFRITEPQYFAGLKFQEAYLKSTYGISGGVTVAPFMMPSSKADPEAKMHAAIDCRRHLDSAKKQLSGEQYAIVREVCGYDKFAGGRDNKRILEKGLDILAEFWGYK